MSIAIIIILIIALLVCYYNKRIDKDMYEKEIRRLKDIISEYKLGNQAYINKLQKEENIDEKTSILGNEEAEEEKLSEYMSTIENDTNLQTNIMVEDEKTYDEECKRDRHNTQILVTGAILIVLAAIVFLTSTWTLVPNIIKTLVIILLIGLFAGLSKVAKEKFKLVKTAETFYYIALAYIPIAFLAISICSLLGNYLSWSGEGKYLFLTISSALVSIIYYAEEIRTQKKGLKIASIIMQELTIICAVKMFTINYEYVLLSLCIYNFAIQFIIKDKAINILCNLAMAVISIISIFYSLLYEITIISTINILITTINYFIKRGKDIIYEHLFIMFSYITVLLFVNVNLFNFTLIVKELIISIVAMTIYVYGFYDNDGQKINTLYSLVALLLIYFCTSTIVQILVCVFLNLAIILSYFKRRHFQRYLVLIIPISLTILVIHILQKINIDFYYILYFNILLSFISLVVKGKSRKSRVLLNYIKVESNILILIFGIIGFIIGIVFNTNIWNLPLYIIAILHGVFKYLKDRDISSKISIYLFSDFLLLLGFKLMNLTEIMRYVIPSTTIVFTILEMLMSKDNVNQYWIDGYMILSIIVACICLYIDMTIISLLFLTVVLMMFIIYIKKFELNKMFELLPMIAIIPATYFIQIATIGGINLNIILSFVLIIITTKLSTKDKELNIYFIMSAIYLAMQIIFFDINKYVDLATIILYLIVNLSIRNNNILKTLLYISYLILYNTIIKDLELESITAINLLGYMVIVIIISRNVIKDISKDGMKFFEMGSYICICIIAITQYADEYDGMFFIALLAIIMMICYLQKIGPIFLTCIGAILVNVFLLTRWLWFSIPWWIYLASLGAILLIFAMRNEAKDNKKENIIIEKIKYYINE